MTGRLRIITINFWGNEPDVNARVALAERQLRVHDVDVIAMQEVRPLNGRNGPTTADLLCAGLDMRHVYAQTIEWSDDAFFPGHPGGQEGLAILSRHPIGEHRVLRLPEDRPTEKRILLSARIDMPDAQVWCHSTHLHYRLDDGLAREKQVVAIDDAVRAIDTDAPQILCGDFNASPDHDEIRFLRGRTTLAGRRTHYQDAFAHHCPNEAGITWSSENELTRPLRSLDIDRRIDYVFVTTRKKDGRGTIHDARVVLTERDEHGNCASDHYGVMAEVQIVLDPERLHA